MVFSEYILIKDDLIEERPWFLMSWGPPRPNLVQSLGRAGQITPLILKRAVDRYQLVCGYRRRQVLRESGCREFMALVLPDQTTAAQALRLALEDNLGVRRPNDAEKVLILTALSQHLPRAETVRDYLPRLELPPREEYLDRFLRLASLGDRGLDLLADGRLDPETGEKILDLASIDDRLAALDLLDALQPSRNKRRDLLGWLEEVARRENRSVAELIKEKDLSGILASDRLNKPQKEQNVRRWLRHRRYPLLTAMEQKQTALLRALPLSSQFDLTPPRNFEGLEFSLQITFQDLDDLRHRAQTLQRLLEDQRLAELLDLG